MNRFRNSISVLLLSCAALGILLSMAHYHSEGLECLDHANEQHYTENEFYCPVCSIVTYTDTGDSPSFAHVLQYEEILVDEQELFIATDFHTPLLGRAPPV